MFLVPVKLANFGIGPCKLFCWFWSLISEIIAFSPYFLPSTDPLNAKMSHESPCNYVTIPVVPTNAHVASQTATSSSSSPNHLPLPLSHDPHRPPLLISHVSKI